MNHNDYCAVFITAPNDDEAVRIVHEIVSRRLAACASIIPHIRSVYWWDGKINDESEVMIIAKTIRNRFDDLREAVISIHSYEVPEIVALPIAAGLQSYLNWIDDTLEDK